jgi:hypothetical protein
MARQEAKAIRQYLKASTVQEELALNASRS